MSDDNSGDEIALTSFDLFQLPVEVFLNVCSFLDAASLRRLSSTCRHAECILKDPNNLWTIKVNQWKRQRDVGSPFQSCLAARREKLFSPTSPYAAVQLISNWERTVKAQLIFFPSKVSSSAMFMRAADRSSYVVYKSHRILACRKISGPSEAICEVADNVDDAPANCLSAVGCHAVHLCRWDNFVSSWKFTDAALVLERTFETRPSRPNDRSSCISNCWEQTVFATGSHFGFVTLFDRRANDCPIRKSRSQSFVDKVALNGEYVFSLGHSACADKNTTVDVWDRRTDKLLRSTMISSSLRSMCMDVRHGWICVGGKQTLYVLNPVNDYEAPRLYPTAHSHVITGIRLTERVLAMSSEDGGVTISVPSDPPKLVATLRSTKKSTCVDYSDDEDALVVATSSNIDLWRPMREKLL